MKILSTLILLCLWPLLLHAEDTGVSEPEIALRKTMEFEIKGKPGKGFKISAVVTNEQTYLTERSTARNQFYIVKSDWEDIDDIKAVCRGKKLKKKYIQELYPPPEDAFYSEKEYYRIIFPDDLKPGDVISYSYQKKYKDAAFVPLISIPNANSLEKLTILIKHPKEASIDYEAFFPRDEVPCIRRELSDKETELVFGPIAHFEELPFYAHNSYHGVLLLRLRWEDEAINPVSPVDFFNWYENLTTLQPTLTDSLVGSLQLCFTDCMDVEDSLAVINDFIRNNIRYISEVDHPHSIVPHTPSVVLAKRYGDCKDRANLVCALARTYGIPVNMAAITAVPYVRFEGVHPSLFNHVICHYDDNGTPVFFDPTAKHFACGDLPEELVDQRAFVFDTGAPRMIDLPTPLDTPMVDIRISGHIDSLGSCRAGITLRKAKMADALGARAQLAGFKLQTVLEAIVSSHLYRISLDSLEFDTIGYNQLTLTGRANLSDFVVGSGANKYVPRTPCITSGNAIFERENDQWPLHLENRAFATLTIELVVPGLSVLPDSTDIQLDGNTVFIATARTNDSGSAQFQYYLRRTEKNIPVERKAAFLDFCRRYSNMKTEMFVLKQEGT